MDKLEELIIRFDEITYSLSKEDILELDKDDNGPLHNVITRINKYCYGVRLFDDKKGIIVEMFYVSNDKNLEGNIIQLQLDEKNYFHLLMRFTALLADKYKEVNEIIAFNTFQVKLRGLLEKLGFFTTTSLELKPFEGKNAVMFSPSERGIKNVILIDPTDFYRNFFNNIYSIEIIDKCEYVYLMVNNGTGYIKIGTSKNPRHRERTLHSQEPTIFVIALWCCDKKIEKELHEKFKEKRIRGEWFDLKLRDLKYIEEFMTTKTTTVNTHL
ncbi:GIY-YIG nuclease family protein [Flavobacterium sufflavum]|nr:GIY-YIG nuclease family protein [Flavobacterium sufflavum]